MTAATADVDQALAKRIEPPRPPRTHAELARTMKLPDGPRVGEPWDPSTEPVQEVWVARLDDRRFRRRTLVTPSQRGKSLMAIALPLVRTLTELTQNVSYIMPNLDKLNQNWEGKVRPLIKGCGYGAWLPERGPGSRGGRPAALTLHNPETGARPGTLYFQAASGGGKETSLASVTALRACADEGDDFESAAHLVLGRKRTESFGAEGMFDAVSTVNDRKGRDGHPILESYELGTRTRLWFQCPHCAWKGESAGFQILNPDHVVYDGADGPTAAASARYRCTWCAVLWTEADRKTALLTWREVHHGQSVNAAGVVTGDEPRGTHYSLLATDLDWNMSSLASWAEEHWAAAAALRDRGDHSLMRLHYHKRRCQDYSADLEELEHGAELRWNDLLRRSQECRWGPSIHTTDKGDPDGYLYSRHVAEAPSEALFAVGGIDVQNNRVYPVVIAGNLDNTTWDMAWSYQYARKDHAPWSRAELHRLLDDVRLWMQRIVAPLPLVMVGVDSGDFSDDVRTWVDAQPGQVWKAVKGTQSLLKPSAGDIDGLIWNKDGLHHIHTDHTRDFVHAALRRPNGQAGAAHIPFGLNNNPSDRAYLQHLVAEMLILDPRTRKQRLRKGPGRWDWLDARRYAFALYRLAVQREQQRLAEERAAGELGDRGDRDTWDSAV